MIQVRFDEQSRSRLVLIWEDVAPGPSPVVDASAANLLFSVLGHRQDGMIKAEAKPSPAHIAAPAKVAAPRRRKPRVARAKAH